MEHAESPSPPSSRLPWDFHPALTEDRLRICARMLAHARRDALAMASYELDDNPWSVGCRAFAFGRHRLKRAAHSGDYPGSRCWTTAPTSSSSSARMAAACQCASTVARADEPTERTL